MTDWDDDDFNDGDASQLVKDLRKQLKDKSALLKERDDRLAVLEPQVRATGLSSILAELNVKDPRVAKLMPKDLDVTKENVEAWLGEYGDLFNIKQTEDTGSGETVPDADDKPDEGQQDWQRFQSQSNAAGAAAPSTESQQMELLQRANTASGGNVDTYFAMLRGEIPIPS